MNDLTFITSNRLREALENANINAQELSKKSGVNKASISQYVNGVHAPSNITAYKMGQVLDVSPEWLMGFEVEMTPQKEIPNYVSGTIEIIDLYSRATPEQRQAVLNLLRSFVQD